MKNFNIGDIGVIVKSKHPWNNGIEVKITEISEDEIKCKSTKENEQGRFMNYILGYKNFKLTGQTGPFN